MSTPTRPTRLLPGLVRRLRRPFSGPRPPSTVEQRIAHLEGYQTASGCFASLFGIILTVVASAAAYQVITASIDRAVESRVSSEVSAYTTAIAQAVSTSVAARNESALAATQIFTALNPTSTPSPSTAEAEEAFRHYFDLLNQQRYSEAWAMLTEGFRFRSGTEGFNAYVSFWRTIQRVDILELSIESRTAASVSYVVLLRWNFPSGLVQDRAYIFTLIYAGDIGAWKIDSAIDA